MKWLICVLSAFLLAACATVDVRMPDDFTYREINSGEYIIATWSRITSSNDPVHVYIEGDGHAFDVNGAPTRNPTPRGDAMRRLATRDNSPNVAYIARPCQFIMSDSCNVSDWTDGRFSPRIIRAMSDVVVKIAANRPVVLIGYSGGAMVSGLIIQTSGKLNVIEWITIAGVLNHSDWTRHFGDAPLNKSMDMIELPNVPQRHYIMENDDVVPNELSRRVAKGSDIVVVPGAGHDDLDKVDIQELIDKN